MPNPNREKEQDIKEDTQKNMDQMLSLKELDWKT